MLKSPLIVPGAAWRPFVEPTIWRITAMASLPYTTITITGDAIMDLSTNGKNERSMRCA